MRFVHASAVLLLSFTANAIALAAPSELEQDIVWLSSSAFEKRDELAARGQTGGCCGCNTPLGIRYTEAGNLIHAAEQLYQPGNNCDTGTSGQAERMACVGNSAIWIASPNNRPGGDTCVLMAQYALQIVKSCGAFSGNSVNVQGQICDSENFCVIVTDGC